MSSELPTDDVEVDEVFLSVYNKTKTLFLDPGQILNLCLKLMFICLSLFSLRKKIISE